MDYAKILKDIAIELVEDKDHLEVREMPSLEEDVVVLHVYSAKSDIARLIGRKGMRLIQLDSLCLLLVAWPIKN